MKEPGLFVFLGILAIFPFVARFSAETLDWILSKIRKAKSEEGTSESRTVET